MGDGAIDERRPREGYFHLLELWEIFEILLVLLSEKKRR